MLGCLGFVCLVSLAFLVLLCCLFFCLPGAADHLQLLEAAARKAAEHAAKGGKASEASKRGLLSLPLSSPLLLLCLLLNATSLASLETRDRRQKEVENVSLAAGVV